VRPGYKSSHGPDVQDAATFPPDHFWQKQAGQFHQRGNVDRHDLQLALQWQVYERAMQAEAGVIDQYVHRDSPAFRSEKILAGDSGKARSAVKTSTLMSCA